MGPNPQETADLVTFTEQILNWRIHFLFRKSTEFILISCCATCTLPENLHIKKLGEFTVFYAMSVTHLRLSCEKIQNQNQFERHSNSVDGSCSSVFIISFLQIVTFCNIA